MIKPDDTIEELLEKYPEMASFLKKWDIVCVQCGEPVWDRLGDVIKRKDLNLDEIMAAINTRFEENT